VSRFAGSDRQRVVGVPVLQVTRPPPVGERLGAVRLLGMAVESTVERTAYGQPYELGASPIFGRGHAFEIAGASVVDFNKELLHILEHMPRP
jgi:hypothetical protein